MRHWTLHVDTKAQAHHSPALLFDILMDCEKAPTRFRWIQRLEKHTPGPTRVGTKFTQFMNVYGFRRRVLLTVDEFDPPNTYALKMNDGRNTGRQKIRLRESESGTGVELHEESSLGILQVLIWPLTKSSVVLFCEDFIEDLIAAADVIAPNADKESAR